ncbi:MAG: hypothetical protein ACXWUN_04175, partial [Allosphingosinicella sp.]
MRGAGSARGFGSARGGVSTRGFGLLEVFITSNGQVKRRSYNAGWSNWQALPSLPSGVWAASS